MKYNELKTGEIYFCNFYGGTEYTYIMRKEEGDSFASYLQIKPFFYFHIRSGRFDVMSNIFREATYEEKKHFLQCEKAGKYVKYKLELVNYEIY